MSNICIVPWSQIDLGAMGMIRPCCEYDGFVGDLNEQTILEAYLGEKYTQVRQDFLDGKFPEGCRKCMLQEQAGLESRRIQENRKYSNYLSKIKSTLPWDPFLIDIKLGNKCNMKCRICASTNSHLWEPDEQELFGYLRNQGRNAQWFKNDKVWSELKLGLGQLDTLYISGGEPFIIKENFELLSHLIDNGRAEYVQVRIITNGTVKLTTKMIDIFKQFKSVSLMYSIDGVEDEFTYQRHPVKWNKVADNFIDALQYDFLDISVVYTVSIFNCLSSQQFLDWCPTKNIFVNFVRDPFVFDLSVLTDYQKEQVTNRLSDNIIDTQIKKYMTTTFRNVDNIEEQRNHYINGIDKIRNESFKDTFPIVAEILNV